MQGLAQEGVALGEGPEGPVAGDATDFHVDRIAAGKLKSTDGIYGVRFAHNTDGAVFGLTMTKQ